MKFFLSAIFKHVWCGQCGIRYNPKETAEHFMSHSMNTSSEFQCRYCKKFYVRKFCLTRHLTTCKYKMGACGQGLDC